MTLAGPSVADTLVLLLFIPQLLSTTSAIKNREERDVYKILQPSSQLFSDKDSETPSHYHKTNNIERKNFVPPLHHSGNKHAQKIDNSDNQLKLFDVSVLNSVPRRKSSVFHKQSSTQFLDDKDRSLQFDKRPQDLYDVSTAGPQKKVFETSESGRESKERAQKTVFLYKPGVNINSELQVKNKKYLNSSEAESEYKNSDSNVQRKIKRSVITLHGSENTQTAGCVNQSSVNTTCKNDGNFNFVPGSDDSSRTQLNNTFNDRSRKIMKDFSPFSLSRLTLPVQKKKFADVTDISLGYRSLSTSDPSQKHWSTIASGNDTSVTASKSINISYTVPSVRPAGRLAATSIPPEGLDAASIAGITVGSIVFLGIVGAMCFILYKRRNQNKPQTLSDKSSNPDSSVYIEESSDDSEEMYSLDNDSFLNSLEAMTIQNYWTENVKHTKL